MKMKTTTTKAKKKKQQQQFELCKVCRINHDDGRRHNFFPRHTKALSSLFDRLRKKVDDVRFFLKNPVLLRPEHASRNRFWCAFCDSDVDEIETNIASSNAIRHLASEDHLKNVKHFLWKYGGGMERIDSFRLLREDLAKWERRCEALSKEATFVGGSSGVLDRVPNDIQTHCTITNSSEKNNFKFFDSSTSHDVMPLQYSTDEDCQVNRSKGFQAANAGLGFPAGASCLPLAMQCNSSMHKFEDLADVNSAYGGSQHSNFSNHVTTIANGHTDNNSVYLVKLKSCGSSSSMDTGFQNLTQIPAWGIEESGGNVHSGAPPPWLEATEEVNIITDPPSSMKSRKSGKLNPKRVGAAWAEKRKLELQMEKGGEVAAKDYDADWLPNFGRVWQSGTRKESKKEFEKEKHKSLLDGTSSELVEVQPYISKRMKRDSIEDSSECCAEGCGHVLKLLHKQFQPS